MFQPYELVVDASRAPGDSHVLKLTYDETRYGKSAAETMARDIAASVNVMAEPGSENLPVGAF